VRDDVRLDSAVDLGGKNAVLDEVELCAVRPEAHDAIGPTARDAGDLEQLGQSGVIDVDALGRGWSCGRRAVWPVRVAIPVLSDPRKAHDER